MELTGKCKEAFKNWYTQSKREWKVSYYIFTSLPLSMKYGVYVDFFDSVGLIIEIDELQDEWCSFINGNPGKCNWEDRSRQEAREQAIQKANELFNNK